MGSQEIDWSLYAACYKCKACAGQPCDPDYDDGSWFGFLGNIKCAGRAFVNQELAVDYCKSHFCLSRFIAQDGTERWTDRHGHIADDYNGICYESARPQLKEYLSRGQLSRADSIGPRGTPEEAASGRYLTDAKYGAYEAGHGEYLVYLRFGKSVDDRCLGAQGVAEFGYPINVSELIGYLMDQSLPLKFRNTLARCIGDMGGPEAMSALWRGLENKEFPVAVRTSCLVGLADQWSRGWEMYQMHPARYAIPYSDRDRLSALLDDPDMRESIASVMSCFD